jgi:hypothetical protein
LNQATGKLTATEAKLNQTKQELAVANARFEELAPQVRACVPSPPPPSLPHPALCVRAPCASGRGRAFRARSAGGARSVHVLPGSRVPCSSGRGRALRARPAGGARSVRAAPCAGTRTCSLACSLRRQERTPRRPQPDSADADADTIPGGEGGRAGGAGEALSARQEQNKLDTPQLSRQGRWKQRKVTEELLDKFARDAAATHFPTKDMLEKAQRRERALFIARLIT